MIASTTRILDRGCGKPLLFLVRRMLAVVPKEGHVFDGMTSAHARELPNKIAS
jgi:hypothetical protein